MNPTLYDILGVPQNAGRDVIKAAWRDAADRFEPGSGSSSAQFRLFNEAAEVLLDPERRQAYDEQLAAQQPGPVAEPADERRAERRGVPVVVLAVLAVLTAVALGGAAYLGAEHQRASAYRDALDQAPASAERAAAAILSYDHESLTADRDAAARFLTPGYRDEYVDTFDAMVMDAATETKARVEAKVLASSAMPQAGGRDPDRIPVLLFVDQTTLRAVRTEEPSLALNRVRFDMVNVDGTWLVDGITAY